MMQYYQLPFLLLAFSLLFGSCSQEDESISTPSTMQLIRGRDYEEKRFNVYQMRVPNHWIRKDPLPEDSLTDTTKSLCEFFIFNPEGTIRITLHNFPSDTIGQRIPAAAQIARWKKQFEHLNPEDTAVIPQSFSGFAGLRLKGTGLLNQIPTTVLGWSLQLGDELYRELSSPFASREKNLAREMRADVTIKATGPKEQMEIHEDDIIHFARSFELIEEIPSRS